MIQLRYNGCGDCLNSAKTLLMGLGLFNNRDYLIEFHREHRKDAIYKARPDYLKHFTGAILYNPDNQSWIDLYDKGRLINLDNGNDRTILNFFA